MSRSIVTIQIDKDVPVPGPRYRDGGAFSAAVNAALQQMSAGDSFVYSDESKSRSLATTVRGIAKKVSVKVVIRKISDNDYRVWRAE